MKRRPAVLRRRTIRWRGNVYRATAEKSHFLSRAGSHATKGSRRGFVRDDFVALHREQILAEREICLELHRVCRKKTTALLAAGGQHEKASALGRFNRKLKQAKKALNDYSFLISEYVDQKKGDHRDVGYFERARSFARSVGEQLEQLKSQIGAI